MSNAVLIIAAHPDDEILGCGATIAKMSRERPVQIKLMGQGIGARNLTFAAQQQGIAALTEAAKAAADCVGAAPPFLGSQQFRDNAFDAGPLLELVQEIERVIRVVQPETIYTHHAGDLNIDHRLTFHAVLTACRPMRGSSVKRIYSFEVPSATDWAFQQLAPWTPTRFVDVADTLERKLQALACYDSEARAFPHPRSQEAIRARALWWGAVAGVPAAEAFQVIREIS